MNILKIKNLTKEYKRGKIVLDKINIKVDKGEFIAIMGPSGSGKTTLLNLIATIDNISSGKIYINGEEVNKYNEKKLSKFREKHLGFVFQDYNLLDNLNVYDNIALPLVLKKEKKDELSLKINKISNNLGINEILKSFPAQISGGQAQRVSIARALIKNPSIILADEPTGALDSKSASNVLDKLNEININDNQTIICVTHDAHVASFANRVIFLRDGKIIEEVEKNQESNLKFYKLLLEKVSMNIES